MIETVRFSEHGECNYVQLVIGSPEESAEAHSQAGRAPGHLEESSLHPPVVSPPSSPHGTLSPDEQGSSGLEFMGDILPDVWAGLFCQQQQLLDPVQPWLRQRPKGIYRDQWPLVESSESCILHYLCIYGPDAEVLIPRLVFLGEHTALLVQGLISAIADQCSEEAQRLLDSHTAEIENDSPSLNTSSSSSSSSSRSTSNRP
ncbi:E3 ubiquitin-protein ligase Topors-like protein [Willisornis vidua]|uniref:E3 ubiquitin-protein ligase Topors-like protein n=1 Tax=Willisornis vidua TaxID=1566151 RepID=A0ABQ9DC70_9PASS|nr:E3 ubiquitin-protein ligase Topors-like protein [Willisornis vidua]